VKPFCPSNRSNFQVHNLHRYVKVWLYPGGYNMGPHDAGGLNLNGAASMLGENMWGLYRPHPAHPLLVKTVPPIE
jgi:hypothetical protein